VRRQFKLPEEDELCLDARGLSWETFVEQQVQWVVVYKYPIPLGYTCTFATLALRIPPSYPTEQIDMVYFDPHLSLANSRAINALTPHPLDGKQFQQWSRHRTAQNPWRPGEDNICSHLLQVDTWLTREVR
jgi:hypothetical protein